MRPEDATLLDVMVSCFDQQETVRGHFVCWLPLPDEETAKRKYKSLAFEAGELFSRFSRGSFYEVPHVLGRMLKWVRPSSSLEIRQLGRGLAVLVRDTGVEDWWHDPETWNSLKPLRRWVYEG